MNENDKTENTKTEIISVKYNFKNLIKNVLKYGGCMK